MRRKMILIIGAMLAAGRLWAGDPELVSISDELLAEAQNLSRQTQERVYRHEKNKDEMAETVKSLKALIGTYERQAGLLRDERPGRRDDHRRGDRQEVTSLGTSSAVKDGMSVLYTDENLRRVRYNTIRVEHVSGDAHIRIHKIVVVTTHGREQTFDVGGGKYYLGDGVEVTLDRPASVSEVRVFVQHRTGGLLVTGDPAPREKEVELPTVVKLGRTGGGKDRTLVLNTEVEYRRVMFYKLRIRNLGGDEFVRLYLLEVHTPDGEVIPLDVKKGKFAPGDVLEIELPKRTAIQSVQVYVQHQTDGLEIEGVR